MRKEFFFKPCRECAAFYQPVDWMIWRVVGFCSEQCLGKYAEAMIMDLEVEVSLES